MKGVFIRKNSPYYYLRYYDVLQADPKQRRREICTKIQVTAADRAKFDNRTPGVAVEIQGTPELWRKVKDYKISLADRKFEHVTGSVLKKHLSISEGYKEFKSLRSTPGIKNQLKPKTISTYDRSVELLIKACGDIQVSKFKEKEFLKLLNYLNELKLSYNTRSMYTRTLKTMFLYFVSKNYCEKNYIVPVTSEKGQPKPIPLADLHKIIEYYRNKKDSPHHYQIIYFMLLTGCRPSTAIVQLKEDIFFDQNYLVMQNIKTGSIKNKLTFPFPLFNDLRELLIEMKVKQGDRGRLFNMFAVVENKYTTPLIFWERDMRILVKKKTIKQKYMLKQLRSTCLTYLVNELGIDVFTVKQLADHANIKTTEEHYVLFNLDKVRKELDKVKFFQLNTNNKK